MNKNQANCFLSRCLSTKLGRFKMRTQILIINGIILAILIPFLLIAQTINMQYVQQILNDALKRNSISEMSKHLTSASTALNYQLNSVFKRTQITLTNLNQLYWMQLNNDIITTQQLSRTCDYNQTTIPYENNYSIICFSRFGLEQNEQNPYLNGDINQQLQSITNLISSTILSLIRLNDEFLPNQIYFVSSINSVQYGFLYPQVIIYPNFNPKERQWYQQHFKNLEKDKNNNTQLTDIYRYFDTQPIYSMTMTQSMLNLNKEVEGIFCSDLIFKNSYIPQLNINVMIVNTNGTLILTNYKNIAVSNSSALTRFDDEEITGFTNEDWNSILNYYYNKKLNSTCNYEDLDILCRFNSIYNKDVVIKIVKLQNINYFLILFYDIQIEQEIEYKIKLLLQILNQNFNQMIFITILISFGLILLQVILIYLIFQPMYQIIRQSFFFLKKQEKSKLSGQLNFFKELNKFEEIMKKQKNLKENFIDNNNALMQFKMQFDTLFDRVLTQKRDINPQCQILQQFKYPRQSVHHTLDILQILKEGKISDNYYEQQISNPRKFYQRKTFSFRVESS
ncbi:unnamed protein product [Paramecium primaurelia]|uniref:Uncharacterized protein n=1 Tax=Paramecium primaurelia TaxID=5886 RepID=A0A8S1NR14_PARPR|nr:unnamed protein product [Paramecium primaurelia]